MRRYFFTGKSLLIIALLFGYTNLNAQSADGKSSKSTSKESVEASEHIARNMLLYQRNAGGWPKHVNDVKVDYTKKLTEAQQASVRDDAGRNDATIDNGATVKEIRFLTEYYKKTGTKEYLAAAEKGLRYLLEAQYDNGGWPQFFPDTSGYRKHITYNDNAMINVLNLLEDVKLGQNPMDVIDRSIVSKCAAAVSKGVDCILKTQVRVNGKLTAWCAQHDKNTFLPAKARSYELISLSGMESAKIIEFLLRQKNPSEEIKASVVAGVNWLNDVKLNGMKFASIPDSTKARGYDRALVADPKESVWARFYEVETNEPFISGRDGVKKKDLKDIDYERRVGYAWYGNWPKDLLQEKYPAWAASNLKKPVSTKQ